MPSVSAFFEEDVEGNIRMRQGPIVIVICGAAFLVSFFFICYRALRIKREHLMSFRKDLPDEDKAEFDRQTGFFKWIWQ